MTFGMCARSVTRESFPPKTCFFADWDKHLFFYRKVGFVPVHAYGHHTGGSRSCSHMYTTLLHSPNRSRNTDRCCLVWVCYYRRGVSARWCESAEGVSSLSPWYRSEAQAVAPSHSSDNILPWDVAGASPAVEVGPHC